MSLFSELNEQELFKLNSRRTTIRFKEGEFLYKEGGRPIGLMCLNEGTVKISVNGCTGSELIIALKKPVDFLGITNMVTQHPYSSIAVALEECELCLIPQEDFFAILQSNNNFLLKVNRLFGIEINKAHLRMASLTQKHMRARLADSLLFIQEEFGESLLDGSLNMSIKRSDLAALANMTTSNAIRTLSELVDSQIVRVEKRKITILSPNHLRSISLRG